MAGITELLWLVRKNFGKIIDDNRIDVAVAYTPDGKLSLRQRNMRTEQDIQIDCSAIASAFKEGRRNP